ncbi:MAG: hypothetical protein WC551_09305 [Patescibacteria group bacterium]
MKINAYQEAAALLGKRESRKLANNTYMVRDTDKQITIRLHATSIITFLAGGKIILDSGGWKTPTTKDRLNMGPWRIEQAGGIWYLHYEGMESVFYDGITLYRGKIVKPQALEKAIREHKRIMALIKRYTDAVNNLDTLPEPSAGDCWFCGMYTVDEGVPLGERVCNTGHIMDHLKERYIMGSLILNALKAAGYWEPGLTWQMERDRKGERGNTVRALRRYFKAQLGMVR